MSASNVERVRIGLYGDNGHQLRPDAQPAWREYGTVVAFAGFAGEEPSGSTSAARADERPKRRASLDDLLADDSIELVSLCSPRRADQADDAIRCLEAGKHVLAEKPCAMDETSLDRIIAAARRTGRVFHEMAPTVVEEPYATIRRVVAAGRVGRVLQVYGQKSYPWHDRRPADEAIDGGLLRQAGIYLYRFVEHVAGQRVVETIGYETTLANQGGDSDCRRAASVIMRLEGGGVASGVANYATPAPSLWNRWGYETLRVFGEDGFVESINRGEIVRLATNAEGTVDLGAGGDARAAGAHGAPRDFTSLVLREILGLDRPVLGLEAELHPTRMVNRAKAAAEAACG